MRYREFFLDITNLYKQRPDLRAFIEVILSISTITMFLLFALKPTALTIIDLVKEINEKKAVVSKLDQKISDLQVARNLLNQNQSLIPYLDTAIETLPKPDIVSKQIMGLASKDSVSVSGLSIGQVILVGKDTSARRISEFKPLPGDAREMAISINVQGDYAALSTFARDFENLRITTKIDTLEISTSTSSQGSVIVALISGRVPFTGE